MLKGVLTSSETLQEREQMERDGVLRRECQKGPRQESGRCEHFEKESILSSGSQTFIP